ncbi:ferritin-like domain-containing protein [Mycobacterium sp. ITM-2016-00316]|uniref:ferritin-like domain-containing protein n=1 Tax=Mycobacterium sp. ITM-2016-00316 TaxID=2099695 RepID=UPI000CF88A14|nr:ferritin-like domain-containing protein [Mycobacterium sp. ITM-2016-00316]WNG84126.1 ferritin-like domain-containing protein [Mycobacterium sp. ITM-2016-00316]
MTSPQPSPDPERPTDAAQAALFDAVAGEHGTIYGYGVVSAHSTPEDNALVAEAMAQHRARREEALVMLAERTVTAPLPAAGYELPLEVTDPGDAAELAVRMESDTATAWRAVLEQAQTPEDRRFAVTAMTQAAVLAARWNQVLGVPQITMAFPGGPETTG